MSTYFHIMPVDRSTIKAKIILNPDLVSDPEAFVRDHQLEVRNIKPTRGTLNGCPTWNLNIDALAYKGIKVELRLLDGARLANATIDFNPGVCLYGHNGRILSLNEFIDALRLLAQTLKPLLLHPDDWVDLIPGLRERGRAYWSYIEVPFHYWDTDGALLARLRHLRHPSITSPSRPWQDSIEAGPRKGALRLCIYRKAVEMGMRRRKGKPLLSDEKLAEDRDILRLEVRMKGKKLIHYFGNEHNVEKIDGKKRLVSFYPQYLIRGHRTCLSELQGVFHLDTPRKTEKPFLSALGRFIAEVACDDRVEQSCPELFAIIKHYTGAKSDTICSMRKAGLAELSRLSSISSENLFSDAAYMEQPGIASEAVERRVCHSFDDVIDHRLITNAYRPPGQPFHPHTEFPIYIREDVAGDYNQNL